jgi:hypothetical protein
MITLIQTNLNSVIGGYNPDQWEDTTGMTCSWDSNCKDITSGSPFLFYFLDDEIEIIKHRDDKIPYKRSDKDWLMVFGYGLWINADQNDTSTAWASRGLWDWP